MIDHTDSKSRSSHLRIISTCCLMPRFRLDAKLFQMFIRQNDPSERRSYPIVKTTRGLPGASSQVDPISESGTVFIAILRFAFATTSKTFLIAFHSADMGTLFNPLPINMI